MFFQVTSTNYRRPNLLAELYPSFITPVNRLSPVLVKSPYKVKGISLKLPLNFFRCFFIRNRKHYEVSFGNFKIKKR